MKNSNVILSIDDEQKVVLKLGPHQCTVMFFNKDEDVLSVYKASSLLKDEAVKAARAILEYYDEY